MATPEIASVSIMNAIGVIIKVCHLHFVQFYDLSTFCVCFPLKMTHMKFLDNGSPRYEEKKGFPWIKIAQIFYSLIRSKSCLVVAEKLT